MIRIYIALYHALLKAMLHKTNDTILTREILKFEVKKKFRQIIILHEKKSQRYLTTMLLEMCTL